MTQTNPAFHTERVAAYQAFEALEVAIDALQRSIAADADRPALVHALPYQGTTDAGDPAGVPAWDQRPLEGQAAREHAIGEIARLRCHPDQHPRTVTRAPGVLAASPATLEAATAVNEAKEAFWNAAQRISPRAATRRRELHAMIPRISLMQTRRHLVAWQQKPKRIHFTWAAHTTSTRSISAGAMDAELEQRLRHGPPEGYDRARWQSLIEYGRQRLAEFPENEPLAIQTPMAPHVRGLVYWHDNEQQRTIRKMNAAPLPFFYPDDGDPVPVQPLPAFDPEAQRAPRADRALEDEPIVEGLRLFRYREGRRSREAA